MKKRIFYDSNATVELRAFDQEARRGFEGLVRILREEGRLSYPDAKKVTRDLFEMRIMEHGVYRGFYAYVWQDHIVILHFFQKKTQRTPLRNIKTALQRLRNYQ